ncbi:MAG TPA: substrate-binding domain-containing protein [Acidimicrobiia bacterium]|nr:substrate-binding domain-containing protein [Acidimicrobiia bacterium]
MTHPLLEITLDEASRTPLSSQIVDATAALIAQGVLRAGMEMPSASQVAEKIGVSTRTVRSAYQRLATRGLISIERGQPLRVVAESPRPADGVSAAVTSVGVLMPSRRTFYGPMLDGIDTASGGATLSFIADARDDPGRALRHLRRLADMGVGGLIAVGSALPAEYGHRITHHGPPIVYLDNGASPDPAVRFDRREAAMIGTRHLLEHGHTRIALVVPDPSRSPGTDIRAGFRAALRQAKIDADGSLEIGAPAYSYGAGRQAADRVMALGVQAVFVGSDTIAAGMHAHLGELGVAIGAELAMAGLGGLEIGTLLTPTLTSVSLPRFAAGRSAMTLLGALAARQPTSSVVHSGALVVRRSCGCGD